MEENNTNEIQETKTEKKGNAGWLVLGLFIPLVGFILWLVWKNDRPGDSKMAGIGALIGFIVSFVFGILSAVLFSTVFQQLFQEFLNQTATFLPYV